MAKLRAALLRGVTEQDIEEMIQGLLQLAKQGDLAACKLLLLYCIGRPNDIADVLAREQTEVALERMDYNLEAVAGQGWP